MKTVQLLAMLLVAFSSIPFMAQLVGTSAQQRASDSVMGNQTSASASANPAGAQANGSAAARPLQLRPVTGELQGNLDSKSARVGDRVVLKTEQSMKTGDGVVIPKGSRLIGHVTEVQTRGSGRPASQLGIVFDHAQLRGGQTLAIQSMIESVEPSRAELAARAMENEDAMASQAGPSMNGGGRMGSGSSTGGGPMMGPGAAASVRMGGSAVPGANVGGVADPAGQPGGNLGPTGGDVMRTAGSAAADTSELAGDTSGAIRGASSEVVSPGEHTTGIPGVVLDSSASGSVSGTLLTTKKNVHLDSGTQMVIGVAAAPQQ